MSEKARESFEMSYSDHYSSETRLNALRMGRMSATPLLCCFTIRMINTMALNCSRVIEDLLFMMKINVKRHGADIFHDTSLMINFAPAKSR